jgi:hypothetical protein
VARYLMKIMMDSDGYFGEDIADRLLQLMIKKPQVVLKRFSRLRDFEDRMDSTVGEYAASEDRAKIADIYRQYPNNDLARKIVGWAETK